MNSRSIVKKSGISASKFFLIFIFSLFTFHYSLIAAVHAAHPLVTDDTGTQGKGKFQLEVNSEFSSDKETVDGETLKATGGEIAAVLSYGIADNLDIILGLPYQWFKEKVDGVAAAEADGISDISLEVKWRFYEKDGLSIALKPGITLPSGDENKGLGNGKMSYGLFLITTKTIEPFAFHVNLGYTNNEYKLQGDKDANRKGIWHVSVASEAEVAKGLRLVANIGIEKNSDKESTTNPAFILGGIIYSISENISIDAGLKFGLNKPETDLTFLAGTAVRF